MQYDELVSWPRSAQDHSLVPEEAPAEIHSGVDVLLEM